MFVILTVRYVSRVGRGQVCTSSVLLLGHRNELLFGRSHLLQLLITGTVGYVLSGNYIVMNAATEQHKSSEP